MGQRVSRTLAVGALAVSASVASVDAQAQTQTVIVTGYRSPTTSTYAFDSFMGQYFGSSYSYSNGFDSPEGEALASIFGPWISKQVTPKAAMTINVCAMTNATAGTRSVTKNSEDSERKAAANQMFYASVPNFVNTRKDGLIVAVVFADGSQEMYRHTSMYGLQAISGTFVPGSGVSQCMG